MISAVILAAGESKRMQSFKQLVEIDGCPMIENVIDAVRGSQVDEILLVLGYKSDYLRNKISLEGVNVVFNPDFEEGISASIRTGLRKVSDDAEAFLIVLGDQPLLESAIINRLIEEYKKGEWSIVAPLYNGVRGNPVLFDTRWRGELMKIRGNVGGSVLLEEWEEKVHAVEVDSPSVILDVDTESDLRGIREYKKESDG